MLYIGQIARKQLDELIDQLVAWGHMPNGHILEYNHIIAYRDRIEEEIKKIPKTAYHELAYYRNHTRYGRYVHKYKTNNRTMWYIVYNKCGEDYFIEYIANNYGNK